MSSLDVRSIDVNPLRKQAAPSTKHEFRIFVTEAAFDRAVARGDADTTREIGGVLVGELLKDEAGPYLKIDATIDALHAEEKGAELTFTHATWEHIHKEMDSQHKDKKVVGWYHTHPGFGVFLSDRDQFIHKSFFNLPFQVAFVYDPKSHEHGMFTWHDNEVWRARRYWIGAREQVWDGARTVDKPLRERAEGDARSITRSAAAGERSEAPRGEASRGDDTSGGTLGMVIVIGIILVLLAGVGGHWLGSGSTQQVINEAQIAVSNARIEGARQQLGQLQTELFGLLRDTLNDDALHRPVRQAVAVIEQLMMLVPPDAIAAADSGGATGAGAVPGSGSGAVAGAGSGSAGTAPGAGSGSGAAAKPGAPDPRWTMLAAQLRTARSSLLQLEQARATAEATLNAIASMSRRGNELPREVARDLADQRAGLGAIYAELAGDAVKAGDKDRARRLLVAAVKLDPGNRVRYDKQLQSFDPSGHLPADSPIGPGAAPGAPGIGPGIPGAAPSMIPTPGVIPGPAPGAAGKGDQR